MTDEDLTNCKGRNASLVLLIMLSIFHAGFAQGMF